MSEAGGPPPWYVDAVMYGIQVQAFADSDGDGCGDFEGLIGRLDHLRDLGVNLLWLLPFFPSPRRDAGYDVTDFMDVDRRFGDLEGFVRLVRESKERGLRVLIDLALNHTSDRHPWFQAARHDRRSRFREYYVWSSNPPPIPPDDGNIFPEQTEGIWTFDDTAGEYYHHRFYHHQPSLHHGSELVGEEVERIIDFWASFGVDGVRLDAAAHMIGPKGGEALEGGHHVLRRYRRRLDERLDAPLVLGEVDEEPEEVNRFFGEGGELNAMFNFYLNNYLFLAFARERAEPIRRAMEAMTEPPPGCRFVNFLRNLDELDLERLTAEEREEVMAAFAPEEEMRVFGRGIRRRLAPMLEDERRIRMAMSLLFSLPGIPMMIYGDEIGMGEDLELEERLPVRASMQWSGARNGGFSDAPKSRLAQPAIRSGPRGYQTVNVEAQRGDPDSLLEYVSRAIRTRRRHPQTGRGRWRALDAGDERVLVHVVEWRDRRLLALHNLSGKRVEARLDPAETRLVKPRVVFPEEVEEGLDLASLALPPYGVRWMVDAASE